MTDVTVFELGDELACVEVPDLNGFIVTCTDKSVGDRIEGESTNKLVVASESLDAFPT